MKPKQSILVVAITVFFTITVLSLAAHKKEDFKGGEGLGGEVIVRQECYNSDDVAIGHSQHIIIIKAPNGSINKSGKYLLTQDMFSPKVDKRNFSAEHIIFVIQYDFELVEDIIIPPGGVLKFEGGSISGNYAITGQYTCIDAALVHIFGDNTVLNGTWNVPYLFPEWFGAVGNGKKDDYVALQRTIEMASTSYTGIYSVKLVNTKQYNISKHINIPPRINIGSTYSNRDKSYDGRNKPKIMVTSEDDAIHFVSEKGLGNSLGFIVLDNIAIIGSSSKDNKGISCLDKNAKYIEKCRLSGLYISNFKFGIYIDGDNYVLNGNVIDDLSIQKNIGIGVYVKTKDIYDLQFNNCHMFQPYIGGVNISTRCITTPITFKHCVFEGCGREYEIADYFKYGSFAINLKSNSDLESVIIENCYFEANSPIKRYKKDSQTSRYEKIASNNNEVFINKPNWDITADIIIDGPLVTINNSVFSELYQIVAINNSGKLVFNNNVLYVPDGWKQYNMYTNSIVRVNDKKNYCSDISISIDLQNFSKENLRKANISEFNEIILSDGTYAQKINANVNIPALNKKYYYASTISGIYATPVLYYNSNAKDNGIGTSFAPFKYFDTLLKYAGSVFDYNETITVRLNSDIIITNDVIFPTGLYFSFKSEDEAKTIEIKHPLSICGSNLYFNNVNIKHGIFSGSSQCGFLLDDCNVYFKNCDIYLNSDSCLFSGSGDNKVIFEDCRIISHSNATHYLKSASNISTRVEMKGKTTKSGNIM